MTTAFRPIAAVFVLGLTLTFTGGSALAQPLGMGQNSASSFGQFTLPIAQQSQSDWLGQRPPRSTAEKILEGVITAKRVLEEIDGFRSERPRQRVQDFPLRRWPTVQIYPPIVVEPRYPEPYVRPRWPEDPADSMRPLRHIEPPVENALPFEPPPVALPKNPLPPPPVVEVQPNAMPATKFGNAAKFELATTGQVEQFSKLLKNQAADNLQALKVAIGPGSPALAKLMDEGERAIQAGQTLPEDWAELVERELLAAGLTQASDADAFRLAKLAPGLAEAYYFVKQALADGATSGNGNTILRSGVFLPSGKLLWIAMPAWPLGRFIILPNGAILAGTGGRGYTRVVEAGPSAVLGVPVGIGEPLIESTDDPSKLITQGVLLRNPAETKTRINYLLTGSRTNFSIRPGGTRHLLGSRPQIRFSRGRGKGEATYALDDGTYTFAANENGWELFREAFSVTIDNSRNNSDFCYVVNNSLARVFAGQTQTHSSPYPIHLRFDRGNGDEAIKQIADNDSVLNVAMNPGDGMWDLYPLSATLPPSRSIVAARPPRRKSTALSSVANAVRTKDDAAATTASVAPPTTVAPPKEIVGTWKAVAKNSNGELSTFELRLDAGGWAQLTLPGPDGKLTTSQRQASYVDREIKLTGPDSEQSLGKVIDVNNRQMVIERSTGTITFVRM